MKLFHVYTTLALSLSATAMAYPAIGDRVEYVGHFSDNRFTRPLTQTTEIVGFVKDRDLYMIRESQELGSETRRSIREAPTKEVMTPQDIAHMISNCEEIGGTSELVIAEAGTFDTCARTKEFNDGSFTKTWYGDVPFGVVRQHWQKFRKSYDITLESYTFGDDETP
ncbi:MAG: hypothetical protein ABIO95_05905 [Bdellovibrionota bacterium]